MQFDQMKCREFISGAAAYLLAGRAQQGEKMRPHLLMNPTGDKDRRPDACEQLAPPTRDLLEVSRSSWLDRTTSR